MQIEHRQAELTKLYRRHAKAKPTNGAAAEQDRSKLTEKDHALIAKLRKGEKANRLMDGDFSDYPSQSEADMALCSILAKQTKDSKQIDRIFRASGLYRKKWDTFHGDDTYGAMTIAKALGEGGTTKTYEGPAGTGQDTTPDEWEPQIKEWPVLDEKAYHGITGDFVRLATRSSESDPAAVLATFLARVGVEFGNDPTLYVGDTMHKARLAAVIVGSSSKARKGTSGKPVLRLFEMVEGRARYSPGPFSSGEGITYAVRDEVKKWNEKKQTYSVVDPGEPDKRLFVLDEEFAGAMAQTKREGNTLSMVIRNAWDNGNLDPLTKTTKTRATNAHVGWVSHITLFELNKRLDETEGFNGFANRILWICAKRSKIVAWPERMPDDELEDIRHRLVEVLSTAQEKGFHVLKWSGEAKAAWCSRHYPDLTRDHQGLVGCVINRAEAQVVRLAMIYCLLDGDDTISLDHLDAALAFWSYCEQSARYIFHGRQADQTAQRILDALQAGPVTATELHKLFGNHLSKERLETVLAELMAAGRIEKDIVKGPGRPATTWKIQTPCEKSEISEISTTDTQDLNSHNPHNSQGINEKTGGMVGVEL